VADPLFWLVLSFVFVSISLTIVLIVAIPTFRELARAARSAEKLFDTLRREFPPTLESIRLTGLEISDLTDDMSKGVQSASQIVQQVDQSLSGARTQAQRFQTGTRSLLVGMKTAWRTFTRSQPAQSRRRTNDRLLPSGSERMELDDRPAQNRNSEPSHLPSEVEDYSAGLTERDRSTYSDDRRE
jgi:hypothetical protein